MSKNSSRNDYISFTDEDLFSEVHQNDLNHSVQLRKSGIAEEARKATQDSSYYLRCINITKRYGKKLALDHFYLAMPKSGECFGLLGENGSGKTTLISILTGMIKPTTGRALVNNRPSHEVGGELSRVDSFALRTLEHASGCFLECCFRCCSAVLLVASFSH
jgi:ABC-type bacteriocin/lantibiotic exporter with double-glycine peptidase domain